MPFGDYFGAWRAMEELCRSGRVRTIGVCNFEPARLLDLCRNAKVLPAIDQLETRPFTQQTSSLRILHELGIRHQAWGPFAEGRNGLFTNETLAAIGRNHGKTVA